MLYKRTNPCSSTKLPRDSIPSPEDASILQKFFPKFNRLSPSKMPLQSHIRQAQYQYILKPKRLRTRCAEPRRTSTFPAEVPRAKGLSAKVNSRSQGSQSSTMREAHPGSRRQSRCRSSRRPSTTARHPSTRTGRTRSHPSGDRCSPRRRAPSLSTRPESDAGSRDGGRSPGSAP